MYSETRIIIAGSRSFSDYDLLKKKCDELFEWIKDPVIISGHARGADTLGERYAKEKNIELKCFPAKWKEYGFKAGFIRNTEMAQYAAKAKRAVLIAFWDGKSTGTRDMIEKAVEYKMEIHIYITEISHDKSHAVLSGMG